MDAQAMPPEVVLRHPCFYVAIEDQDSIKGP